MNKSPAYAGGGRREERPQLRWSFQFQDSAFPVSRKFSPSWVFFDNLTVEWPEDGIGAGCMLPFAPSPCPLPRRGRGWEASARVGCDWKLMGDYRRIAAVSTVMSTFSDKKCRAKLAKVAKGRWTRNLTADYADGADRFGLQHLFRKSGGCGYLRIKRLRRIVRYCPLFPLKSGARSSRRLRRGEGRGT